MKNYNNLIEVTQAFSSESACVEHLEKIRWDGKPVCPFCNSEKTYKTNRGYKCANRECYKKFTVKVGTFFENTKIPLQKWFIAMYLITSHKKGLSSLQLSKDIDVSQKTAWYMLHRIREMLKEKNSELLQGEVEADETFVGGQNKNKHKNKRTDETQGRSLKSKSVILGLYERKGNITSIPIEDTSQKSIYPIVVEKVKKGSELITDEWGGYNILDKQYIHNSVKHSQGEYVNGKYHTNNLEGFWSLLKRGIVGIYHSVSEKHLEKYCNEFNFRYNTRISSEENRIDKAISQCEGRIRYKELIAKTLNDIISKPVESVQMEIFAI